MDLFSLLHSRGFVAFLKVFPGLNKVFQKAIYFAARTLLFLVVLLGSQSHAYCLSRPGKP
jgi:hypothetical protein